MLGAIAHQIRARLSHIRVDWLAEFQSFEGCMEALSKFFLFFASQSVSIIEWTSKSLVSSAGTAPNNWSCTLRVKGGNALLLFSAACNQQILPRSTLPFQNIAKRVINPTANTSGKRQTTAQATAHRLQTLATVNSSTVQKQARATDMSQQTAYTRRQAPDNR